MEDADFPQPAGRVAVELCTIGGKRSIGHCGQTLREWVRPDEMPDADETVIRPHPEGNRLTVSFPAGQRAWASDQGYPIDEVAAQGSVHLSIATPEDNSHLWRNPETPPALDRLALKAVVEPHVAQVVWYVDGEPFAVTDPDKPVLWPIKPGAHRFQLRLPAQDAPSAAVHVVVE